METQFNDYGKLQFAFRYAYLLNTELGERRQKKLTFSADMSAKPLSPFPRP